MPYSRFELHAIQLVQLRISFSLAGRPRDGVDDGDGQDPDGGDHAEGRLRVRRVWRPPEAAHGELDAAEERPQGVLQAVVGEVVGRHTGRQVSSSREWGELVQQDLTPKLRF